MAEIEFQRVTKRFDNGLEALKDRVLTCLQGGADAAGCGMHHEWIDPPFYDMLDNHPLPYQGICGCRTLPGTQDLLNLSSFR